MNWNIYLYLKLFIIGILTTSGEAAGLLKGGSADGYGSSSSRTISTASPTPGAGSSRTLPRDDSGRGLIPKPASQTTCITKLEGHSRNTYVVKESTETLCSITKIEGDKVNTYAVKDGIPTLHYTTDLKGNVTFFS